LQSVPSCNGWTFWHVERHGQSVPLDSLRSTLREGLRA
jgi:modification methylase